MKPLFQKVAILGLGLIGGSIALELKKRGLAGKVAGYNRSAKSRRLALKREACDAVFSNPEAAVAGADLVLFATPVRNIPELAKRIAPALQRGAVLSDVGSTKEALVRRVEKALPKGVAFVGGHPVAGTEKSGMESAETGLFRGRWWIFTPSGQDAARRRAVQRLTRLVRALGAKPVTMSPRAHDEILAMVSHLPHLLAYSLMRTAMDFKRGKALRYAGSSFRDVTRVAASSAAMWADICLDNRRTLLVWLEKYEKNLLTLKKSLKTSDGARLHRFFAGAAAVRRKL